MNRFNVINAVIFKLTWVGCVLGGVVGGAAPLAGLFGVSWWRGTLQDDLKLVSVLALVGFGLDSLWDRLGVLDYVGTSMAPAWIVMLWIAVGLTLNHSLSYFKARPALGGALAGLVAPGSYLIGSGFGGVSIPQPALLGLVALSWALIFTTAFTLLAEKPAGRRPTQEKLA